MDIKLRKNISDITHNHYNYLLDLPNVNGIGFGFKYINGVDTLEPCIHVLVEEKVDSKYISKNNLIPKNYMGIKTDVIKIGRTLNKSEVNSLNTKDLTSNKLFSPNSRKYRPLQAGCGLSCFVSKFSVAAGTLGCIVSKVIDNKKQYYILSNNHVLADENKLPIGISITQPSVTSGGIPYVNSVARLSDFVPTKFVVPGTRPVNYVDCAIAKINNKISISNKLVGLGLITGITEAYINQFVQKSGLTTGITGGIVKTLDVIYATGEDPERAIYENQIAIDLAADSGDSGSVIIDKEGKIIALLMATTELGMTIANKIQLVLDALNVEVYTG